MRPAVVTICVGSSCHLRGAPEIIQRYSALIKERGLEKRLVLKGSFCMGKCAEGVSVKVGEEIFSAATLEEGVRLFEERIMPLVEEA